MGNLNQRSLKGPVSCQGIGLHGGAPARVTLRPAPAGSGITFVRTDLSPSVELRAVSARVVDTHFATTLGQGPVRVGTVEHLLSALFGLGIDNCRVDLDGPEVPILDGSAAPFVYLLRTAGLEVQRQLNRFLVVRRPTEVRRGESFIRISPAPRLAIHCTIDFDHPLIKDQSLQLVINDRTYHRELARARTFTLRRDVERLQAMGLVRGGSLANAIVVDDFNILNPEGLRFADEFVRHKMLDTLGDLALCGMPVLGQIVSYKSGHALNQELVRELCAGNGIAEVVEVREQRQLEKLALASGGFALPSQA